MTITYIQLASLILNKMTTEQQNSDITVFSQDEFYPAELLFLAEDDKEHGGILDDQHPYFKPKDVE